MVPYLTKYTQKTLRKLAISDINPSLPIYYFDNMLESYYVLNFFLKIKILDLDLASLI